MATMNLKPISWVGDVYNRFESMCLEVEEAICQDTVKFVEDQVQTVGVEVKKFYSDFMQDLLSPSLDTVSEDNLDVVLSKKSKSIGEKKSMDIEAPNLDADATKDLVERKDSVCKSLSAISRPIELRESAELREIQKASNKSLGRDVDYSLSSNSVIKASCSENDGVGISQHMTEGFESSVVDGSEATVPSIGNSFPNSAGELNSEVAYRVQVGDVDEQVAPIDKVIDEAKLGESCVLVEKSDHSFFLPSEYKQKSYKKKIRDVFIQRRWSKGKQDKKQNAVWYEEQSANNLAPISLMQASTKDSQLNEFVESEWEFL